MKENVVSQSNRLQLQYCTIFIKMSPVLLYPWCSVLLRRLMGVFSSFSALCDPRMVFQASIFAPQRPPSSRVLLSLTMRQSSALTRPGLSSHSLLAQRCDQERGGSGLTERALSASGSVLSNPPTPESHP